MAPVTIFAFRQVVTDAVFTTELVECKVWRLGTKLLHSIQYQLTLCAVLQIQRPETLLILLFRQLLVEHTILFLIQAHAAETVAAAETIFAELTLAAVGTVLAVVRHVAVGTVDALGTPLATDAKCQSAAADALA